MRTVGAGWPVSAKPSAIGIRTYRVPGTNVSLPVRAGAAAILLIALAAEFHRTVEPLRAGWCWGYAFRLVRGLFSPSFHGGGVAIDLNAPRHPLGKRGTFSPAQAAQCRRLAKKYGCRWGGDYRGRKDEMHFEIIVSMAAAQVLANRLQTPPKAAVKAPVKAPAKHPVNPTPLLTVGSKGQSVRNIQNALRLDGNYRGALDGDFGPMTRAAVLASQRKHRIPLTGVTDAATWRVLKKVAHPNG